MNQKTLKIILLSYLALILIGAIILMLPFTHEGELKFIDAIFTSTSAVCVTGLIVKSTPEFFNFFGQSVILILIQIGGIGYMSLVTLFFLFTRKKLNIHEKNLAKDSLNYSSNFKIQTFIKKVFLFTFIIEAVGIILLTLLFSAKVPFFQALWEAIFHTISAFNNAGFSLFKDSLMSYNDNYIVISIISTLVILGGIGFLVLVEVHTKIISKRYFLSVHTKITLVGTALLLLVGTILFLTIEWNNTSVFGDMNFLQRILNSFFLSVNFRTAGFNSLDISSLSDASLFCSTVFMMIGGGAGSTAGGIKITTVAVLMITTIHTIKLSNQKPNLFKRTISLDTIQRASAIIIVASFIVICSAIILTQTQHTNFMRTLFETISAFSTVGVSVGDGQVLSFSSEFDSFGKIVIVLLMLIGRVGIFAFGFLIIGKGKVKHTQYPQGRILL